MPVTPAGRISTVLENLKQLIAASTTFQTVVGAANATEAAACVLEFWADEKLAAAELAEIAADEEAEPATHERMPRAIIRHLGDVDTRRDSTTSWLSVGPLHLLFEFETPAEYADDFRQAGINFSNKIGAIQQEMQDVVTGGTVSCLNATSMELMCLGQLDPDSNNGVNVWIAEFVVHHQGI